jgi:hypothetical protein
MTKRNKVKRTTEERFWAKVNKNGPIPEFAPLLGNCWIWTGSRQRYGYGSFGVHDDTHKTGWRRVLAHRFAYELLVGAIPKELPDIDHLCRVSSCVRPFHLEPVTHRENGLRGMAGWLKTHCKNGHEFTAENTYLNPSTGHRSCLICRKAAKKRRDERRRQR